MNKKGFKQNSPV